MRSLSSEGITYSRPSSSPSLGQYDKFAARILLSSGGKTVSVQAQLQRRLLRVLGGMQSPPSMQYDIQQNKRTSASAHAVGRW
jgi:hypothetical protein